MSRLLAGVLVILQMAHEALVSGTIVTKRFVLSHSTAFVFDKHSPGLNGLSPTVAKSRG